MNRLAINGSGRAFLSPDPAEFTRLSPCGHNPAEFTSLTPNCLLRKPGGRMRYGASTRYGARKAWAGVFVRTYLGWKQPMGL